MQKTTFVCRAGRAGAASMPASRSLRRMEIMSPILVQTGKSLPVSGASFQSGRNFQRLHQLQQFQVVFLERLDAPEVVGDFTLQDHTVTEFFEPGRNPDFRMYLIPKNALLISKDRLSHFLVVA